MPDNTNSTYETPTQLAEKRKQNREKDKALATLQFKCNNYSVFLRSDRYDTSTPEKEDATIELQADYITKITLAAMEVYHPGTTEFIEFLESE